MSEGSKSGTSRVGRMRAETREGNDRWCTPHEVLELVRQVGPIALDPCGDPDDVVGAALSVRLADGDDGLAVEWGGLGGEGLVYVNPPYSDPEPWVRKAIDEADRAVLLLPANPDVGWFHAICRSPRATVLLLEGRLAFLRGGQPVKGNRQGSALALVSDQLADVIAFRDACEGLGAFLEQPVPPGIGATIVARAKELDREEAETVERFSHAALSLRRLAEAVEASYRRLGRPCAPPGATAIELAAELLSEQLLDALDESAEMSSARARIEELEHDLEQEEEAHSDEVKKLGEELSESRREADDLAAEKDKYLGELEELRRTAAPAVQP